jgi:hypothetical protein
MEQMVALRSQVPQIIDPQEAFEFTGLRVFTSVPADRDYGIVALRGMVVIYDERPLHTEGILEGAFYVRESQRPASNIWDDWLRREWEDRDRRAGPYVPLVTRREVVQAVRFPRSDKTTNNWAVRLSRGFIDGPYYDWWFGRDFVGKVVGIYRPASEH